MLITRVLDVSFDTQSSENDERTTCRIIFELGPEENRLELETGEVFSGQYRDREKTHIPMEMTVVARRESDSTAKRQISVVHYLEPKESDSLLSVRQYLKRGDFDELLSNLKNGVIPSTILIAFLFESTGNGPIDFGLAFDGSELEWKNKDKKNQVIELEYIEFRYQLLSQSNDEDETIVPDREGQTPVTPIERIEERLTRLQMSLTSFEERLGNATKYLKWLFYLGVILLVIFILGEFK